MENTKRNYDGRVAATPGDENASSEGRAQTHSDQWLAQVLGLFSEEAN
jgi:hypothetical protein